MNSAEVLNILTSKHLENLKDHVIFCFRNTMEILVSSKEQNTELRYQYNPIVDAVLFDKIKAINEVNTLPIKKENIQASEQIENVFLTRFPHTKQEKEETTQSKYWWLSSASIKNVDIVYIQIQFYN